MTTDEARARVAHGVALLDANRPGWTSGINTDVLNLYSIVHCIVGQLCGEYKPHALGVPMDERGWMYGFDINCELGERTSSYRVLQDAWIGAIADRVVEQGTSVGAVARIGSKERRRFDAQGQSSWLQATTRRIHRTEIGDRCLSHRLTET